MPKDKEYRDVKKHYQSEAKKTSASASADSTKQRGLMWWESRKYWEDPSKMPESVDTSSPKAKKPHGLSPSGIKAFKKYMAEKWKQRDLKKQIAKKKAEGAAIRAKKRK